MPEIKSGGASDVLPLPTLEPHSPITAHLKSHSLLFIGILGAIAGCWLFGFELFQPSETTSWQEIAIAVGALTAVGGGLLWFIGLHQIDWWALVMEYWWFSMPILLAIVFMYVRAEEGSLELGEKD
jgi:hypothetical protein